MPDGWTETRMSPDQRARLADPAWIAKALRKGRTRRGNARLIRHLCVLPSHRNRLLGILILDAYVYISKHFRVESPGGATAVSTLISGPVICPSDHVDHGRLNWASIISGAGAETSYVLCAVKAVPKCLWSVHFGWPRRYEHDWPLGPLPRFRRSVKVPSRRGEVNQVLSQWRWKGRVPSHGCIIRCQKSSATLIH